MRDAPAHIRRGGAWGGHVLQGAVTAPTLSSRVFSHSHLVHGDEENPEEMVE